RAGRGRACRPSQTRFGTVGAVVRKCANTRACKNYRTTVPTVPTHADSARIPIPQNRKGDRSIYSNYSPIRGRPRGRKVNSRPSVFKHFSIQESSPYGRPRFTLRRIASSSASVWGRLTSLRQSRGQVVGSRAGTGHDVHAGVRERLDDGPP